MQSGIQSSGSARSAIGARSRSSLFLSAGLCAACFSACRADAEGSRFDRHFSGEIWTGAISVQTQRPDELYPEAFLLGSAVVLRPFDARISEDADDGIVTHGSTTGGDAIAAGLGVLAIGTGVVDACRGDDGRSLEVGAESLLGTEAVTQALKAVVHRHRPGGSSSVTSFPSGHTSFSFAAATFLRRRIAEDGSPPESNLGWLFYVPAAYVAVDRVEGERHFPSDVAAGALLGMFLTNWIWDAHYRRPDETRPSIFPASGAACRFGPTVDDEGHLCLSLGFSF